MARRVQVPFIAAPRNVDSGCSGLNAPVKGAVPDVTAVAAESMNTVFV